MIFVTVSTGHFDPLIEECNRLRDSFSFFGQIGSGVFVPEFPHIRTASPLDIERYMKEAEIVVAHGGTGMLSLLYRLKKRTVVIPKQIRYGESNDGQVELAAKWADLKMAVFCDDVKNLASKIEEARTFSFEFPEFSSLGRYLTHKLKAQAASGILSPES
jgi:UDP-N-acetylglucosamine transferase subunit ALG13